VLVVAQIALGWVAVGWRFSPFKADLYVWHKSVGMLILMVVMVRLLWRLTNTTPAMPANTPIWETRSALATYMLLYVAAIALPLTGWIINSALNIPVLMFWVLPLPAIVVPSEVVAAAAAAAHFTLFVLLSVLLCIHIGAALRHHYVKRNDVLVRMLPGTRTGPLNALACLTALLLAVAPQTVDAAMWAVDPAGSRVEFLTTFERAPAPGVFRDFDVRLSFDPQRPADAGVDVRIAVASADMNSASLNKAIRAPEWFHVERFPHAKFTAIEVRRLPAGGFLMRGMLSLKGIERAVDFPFTWTPAGDAAIMQGELMLNRAEFDIGSGEWIAASVVGQEVRVRFTIRLRRGE
jgi:cytochrome b561